MLAAAAGILATPLSAQKAGQVTKSSGQAFVDQPASRANLAPKAVAATNGTEIRWKDILRTEDGGRMRAQLLDGSILSIGSKTHLTVIKHDAKTQDSQFELKYGQVRAQVQHISQSGSDFTVRTDTAVCGVLGTDEAIDANNPTATVIIAISGIVVVKSSNPSIPGSVQLTPGQTTTVNQGQPPTQPTQATPGQIAGIVSNTGGTTNPDPTVSNPTPQLKIGAPLTLDGRASTGGLGSVGSYNWAIDNSLNQVVYSSTNPVLSVDTNTWAPGGYTGTLTVTNTATPPQSASVTFTFTLVAPDPGPTIPALAQAYQTGQVQTFMNLFDPVRYTGFAALEQSIQQSFNNITVTGVNILTTAGVATGASTAHYNVTMQIGYTLKNTALPVAGTGTTTGAAAPANLHVNATRGGARTPGNGSISGSAGAVATFVVLSGAQSGFVQTGTNSLGYSFTGLPDGAYTLTPVRSGFNFSPASINVTILNGNAVTGANFTAQPQPLSINVSAILDLGYLPTNGWLITNIAGSLGSAGIVGVPGTSNPQAGLSTGTGGAGAAGATNTGAPTPSFTVTVPTTPVPIIAGGKSGLVPVTITPLNGFLGTITFKYTFSAGLSQLSNLTSVNITSSSPATYYLQFFANGGTTIGSSGVLFSASSGSIGPVFGEIPFSVTQIGAVVNGAGSSSTNPLQLFAGNGTGTANVTISPVVEATTLAVGTGITGAAIAPGAPDANGNAAITVTPNSSATGLQSATINILVARVQVSNFPLFVNLTAPVQNVSAPSQVNVAPGQPATVGISVPFAPGFTGGVVVTPPATGGGLTFSPSSVTLNSSGTANFTVTASSSFAFAQAVRQGAPLTDTFTVTAGKYVTTANVNFTTLAAADFNLAPASSLSVVQNTSQNIVINVTQSGGSGNIPITLTASGFPAGISAAVVGNATTNGSGTVTFSVSATFAAIAGVQSFTVTGTGGGLTHTITVPITVISGASFNLAAALHGSFFDGGGACTNCVTVSVTPIGAFTSSVAITSSSNVATASGPGSIAPGNSAQYTVNATGPGTLTFTGTANGITQTASVQIAFVAGFSLGVSATSTFPGGQSTVTVAVNRASGFASTVIVTPSPTTGVTFTPSSVTVAPGAASAQFTATVASTVSSTTTPAANFSGVAQGGSIIVNGSGTITLTGVPFTLTGGTVQGFAGQTVPIVITVNPGAGFNGAVSVAPTSGLTGIILSPSSVNVPAGQTTATFIATIPSNVTTGGTINFTGTLVGTPGITASTTVTLTIGVPFTLGSGSSLGSMNPGGNASGQLAITLTNGFTGPVTFSASTTSGSATGSVNPNSVTKSGNVTVNATSAANASTGQSTIVVTAQAGTYSQTATFTVSIVTAYTASASTSTSVTLFTGGNSTVGVNVTYAPSFTGTVSSSITTPSGVSAFAQGNSSLTASGVITYGISASTGAVSGPVVVTLSGGNNTVSITFNVNVVTPYTMSMSTNQVQVYSGIGTSVSVNLNFAAGFSGPVTITAPSNLTGIASVSPPSLQANASGSYSFTVTGSATNVTARSGSLGFGSSSGGFNAQASAGYSVIDPYMLSVTPPAPFNDSSTVPYVVTISPNANFQGQVTLTPTVTPSGGTATVTNSGGVTVPVTGSTPVTFSVTIGANVTSIALSTNTISGGFSLGTGNSTVNVAVNNNYSVSVITQAPVLFSTGTASIQVQVTYNQPYSASVTITPPAVLPQGIAGIAGSACAFGSQPQSRRVPQSSSNAVVVTPNSNVACFTVLASQSNPSLFTGMITFTTTDGNGSNGMASTGYSVQDPYRLTFGAVPSTLDNSQSFNYVVNVVPNNGFLGTVSVTPTVNPSGAMSFSPTGPVTVTISSSAAQQASFTATATAMSTGQATPGASTSQQLSNFTLNGNATATTIGGAPFSMSSSTYAVLDGQTQTYSLTVNFVQGYVGTVTVSCSSITASGASPSYVRGGVPARSGLRPSETRLGAANPTCSGLGIGNVVVDASSNATLTANGSAGSQTITWDITGSGTGGGVINFSAVDTNSLTATYKAPFTAQEPFTASMSSQTAYVYPSTQTQVSVTVTFSAGFTGSVLVSPPGTLPAGVASISAAQTATPGSPTVMFTVTGNTINSSANTGCPTYCGNLTFSATTTGLPTPQTVQEPYQFNFPISAQVTMQAMMTAGGSGVMAVSVTPGVGFSSPVSVTESGSLNTGITFNGGSTSATGPFSGSSASGTVQNNTPFVAYFQFSAAGGTQQQSQFVSLSIQVTGAPNSILQGVVDVGPGTSFSVSSPVSGNSYTTFSTVQFAQFIDVAYSNSFNATVTVTGPTSAPGFSSITLNGSNQATPASPQITYNMVASGSNPGPNGTSGTLTYTGTSGATTMQYQLGYTVIDPITVTTQPTTPLMQGMQQNYLVTVKSNNGFAGTVTITPSISSVPSNSASISNSGGMIVQVAANSTMTFTFTVTVGANTTQVTLGGTASANVVSGVSHTTFSVNLLQSTVNGIAFTLTPQNPNVAVFDGKTTTTTLSLTFENGYSGSVTVSCTNIGATGQSPQRAGRIITAPGGPGGSGQRRVAFDPSAGTCSGLGVASVTLPNNTNPLTGSGNTVNVTFTVTGNGTGSGVMHFQATDGTSTATTSENFTAAEPASLLIQGATPVSVFSGLSTSISVAVTDANGFNGTIVVAAPVITGITFAPTSQMAVGSTVVVFTATGMGSHPTPTTGTMTFSATSGNIMAAGGYQLSDPFSIGIQAISSLTAGTTTMTATIAPIDGYNGQVMVVGSATGTGVTATIGAAQTVNVTGSTPVAFSVTISGVTTAGGTVQFGACATTTSTCPTTSPGFSTSTQTSNVNVTPPFTMTATPNPLPVTNGSTSHLSVTLTFASGYSGTVSVSCGSGPPPAALPSSVGRGQPAAMVRPAVHRGAAGISCAGSGISSVTPDAANSSAMLTATGSGGQQTLIFDVAGNGAGSSTLNFIATDLNNDTASYSAPYNATNPPASGVVTAGSTSGFTGQTIQVPINLTITAGGQLDTISFGLQITGNGSEPALSGALSFTAMSPMPSPNITDPVNSNIINVSWTSTLSPPISGTLELGTVSVMIPNNALNNGTYNLIITGASGSFMGNAVPVSPGANGTLTTQVGGAQPASRKIGAAPGTRERMTVNARNENCAGVRFSSGTQSSCGGSVDLEVQPVITSSGTLEVHLSTPNGGMRDLGAMTLASAQFPDADASDGSGGSGGSGGSPDALPSSGMFQQGHTYLFKVGNQLALVRVARIRSSVSPRLAAIPGSGAPSASKSTAQKQAPAVSHSGDDLLNSMRDQQQMNRVLDSAQITIDLEWLMQPSAQ